MKGHWAELLGTPTQPNEETTQMAAVLKERHRAEAVETGGTLDDDEEETRPKDDDDDASSCGSDDCTTNNEVLQRKLESMKYHVPKGIKRVPWIDTLTIVVDRSLQEEAVVPGEDSKMEAKCHDLTLAGVSEALRRLRAIGLPFTRPKDFYAEMLRPDDQMLKVRSQIAQQQERIKAVEERKKRRLEKQFAKKVRAEKLKSKQEQRKKNLAAVKKYAVVAR